MEREVGGGIRMGNTCKPMAVSFQCMTKSTTNKKKKKKKKKTVNYLNIFWEEYLCSAHLSLLLLLLLSRFSRV